MIRQTPVVMLVLAAAAGCASSGTQTPATQRTVAVADGQVLQASEVRGSAQQFDAPAPQVWTALEGAYKSLGIDVNLWWGVVLLVFGLGMLALAWRAARRRG